MRAQAHGRCACLVLRVYPFFVGFEKRKKLRRKPLFGGPLRLRKKHSCPFYRPLEPAMHRCTKGGTRFRLGVAACALSAHACHVQASFRKMFSCQLDIAQKNVPLGGQHVGVKSVCVCDFLCVCVCAKLSRASLYLGSDARYSGGCWGCQIFSLFTKNPCCHPCFYGLCTTALHGRRLSHFCSLHWIPVGLQDLTRPGWILRVEEVCVAAVYSVLDCFDRGLLLMVTENAQVNATC